MIEPAQLDLFAVAPVPKPRTKRAIESLLELEGHYIDGEGQLIRAERARWQKNPPHCAGLWLSSDGINVLVHRVIQTPSRIHICGTSDLVGGLGERVTVDRLGLDWFGPIGEAPESRAFKKKTNLRARLIR